MKQKMKMLIKTLEVGIYAILVGIFFIILSPKLPTNGIIQTYVVPTGSMAPVILPGSVVLIRPDSSINEGDIIAFINPTDRTQTILHRVIEKSPTGIITKGDANDRKDNWTIDSKDVKGRLVFSIPYLGHITAFIKTKIGFGLLVLVPSMFLIFSYIKDIYKGIKEITTKKAEKKASVSILIIFLTFFSFGFAVNSRGAHVVFAQFSAVASISNVSFVSASSSPTPTESPSPTPTPTDSPTPTPSSSPGPNENGCGDIDIEISGNGENSENEVEIECKESHVVIQINHGTEHNDIHVESNYDTEAGHEIKSEDFHPDINEEIHKIDFDLCKDDTCKPEAIKNKKLTITLGSNED